jgi:protein-disulfide isomerase-like protein with CxxC motif
MHLLYFADPLCSWCYGFGPELAKLLERHPDTRLDLVIDDVLEHRLAEIERLAGLRAAGGSPD